MSDNSLDTSHDKLPIRMLHDRVLVRTDIPEGERRSSGGIVIPATAAVGRRLAWAEVVAVGQSVRTVEPADRVLYDPEDRAEVEVRGVAYVLMRTRPARGGRGPLRGVGGLHGAVSLTQASPTRRLRLGCNGCTEGPGDHRHRALPLSLCYV